MRTLSGTVVPSSAIFLAVSPRLFSFDLASSFFFVAALHFLWSSASLQFFILFPFFPTLLRFVLLVALFPDHHLELVAALSSL